MLLHREGREGVKDDGARDSENRTKNRESKEKAGTSSQFISRRKTDQKKKGGNERGHMPTHVSSNSDTPPPSGPLQKLEASPFCFFFPPERSLILRCLPPNKCSPPDVSRLVAKSGVLFDAPPPVI